MFYSKTARTTVGRSAGNVLIFSCTFAFASTNIDREAGVSIDIDGSAAVEGAANTAGQFGVSVNGGEPSKGLPFVKSNDKNESVHFTWGLVVPRDENTVTISVVAKSDGLLDFDVLDRVCRVTIN